MRFRTLTLLGLAFVACPVDLAGAASGPAVPSSVAARATSSSTIVLSWVESDASVTGFSIERSLNASNGFDEIARTGNVRSFQDSGLAKSTTYYYRMRAMRNGDFSVRSAVASATTAAASVGDTTAPSVPSGVTAAAASCAQVSIQWNASIDTGGSGLSAYKVYRNDVFLKTVAPGSLSAADAGLAGGTAYRYAVSAIDGAGNESPRSANANVTTPPCVGTTAVPSPTSTPTRTTTPVRTSTPTRTTTPVRTSTPTRTTTPVRTSTPIRTATMVPTVNPTATPASDNIPPSAPGALSLSATGCTQLNLSWSAATDSGGSGLKSYIVYRDGASFRNVNVPVTTMSDTGLAGGTVHSYFVRARDGAGNLSAASNTATGSTPACNQPPIAQAGPDVTASPGTAVTLSGTGSRDPDGSISTYVWAFGDGASASGAVVSHAYAAVGSFTATLTVIDTAGARASDNAVVTVGSTAASGQVLWRQARGGASSTLPGATATDGDGNVVVVGTFYGTTDLGTGALVSAGIGDIFLAKYSPGGAPLWSRRFGGTANDRGYGVAVDQRPNCDGGGGTDCIVLTGVIEGTADLGRGPLVSTGLGDIVVARYSAAGTPLWTQRYGDAQNDFGYAAAVDPSGNVLVTGFFTASTDFGAGRLYSQYQDADTFVLKLAPSGVLVWARNFWSTSLDAGKAVAVDAAGNVAVAGYYMGSVDVGTGARLSRGQEDIFVAKLAGTDGHGLWFKGFGANMSDLAYGVAVDTAGDVAVTGTAQAAADVGGGAITAAGTDVFVTKLSAAAGAPLWSRRCTGTYTDTRRGSALAVDSAKNLFVAGFFQGTLDCGGGPVTGAATGFSDAFAAKLTSTGVPVWTKAYGASGADAAAAVAADSATGEVVLSGSFQYTVDFGGATLHSTGTDTLFLLKLAR